MTDQKNAPFSPERHDISPTYQFETFFAAFFTASFAAFWHFFAAFLTALFDIPLVTVPFPQLHINSYVSIYPTPTLLFCVPYAVGVGGLGSTWV
jgi:hypothetical protein